MSAEETELTFIRCPSCRSLVPAVATRCRMCGHQFEKKAAAADQEENSENIVKKDSVKKENGDSSYSRPRVRQRTMSANSAQVSEIKEQLRGSLEKNNPPLEKESEIEPDFENDNIDDNVDDDIENEDNFALESSVAEVENPYNFKKPSSESFSFEKKVESEEVKQEVVMPAENKEPKLESDTDIKVQTKKVDMETKEEVQFKDLGSTSNGIKTEERSAFSKEVQVPNDGKLFGWLIAFGNDSNGAASEIRAGRFFIGRQKLRSADMLIPDSSVSTPHCMVTSSSEAGLLVQDLMSEKGTFYKKAGSRSYLQVHHVVELGHGDWLKFGEYEVMVCLVPYEKNNK